MCVYRRDVIMAHNILLLWQYLRLLYHLRKTPGTHRIRGSLGSTVALEVFKRQISSSYREPNPRPSVPLPGNYTPHDIATPDVNMICLLIVSWVQLHSLKLWKSYLLDTLRTGALKLFKCTFPGSKQFKSTFISCFFKNL